MASIREDLIQWGQRCSPSSPNGLAVEGVDSLTGEMGREVDLIAVTPTKQEMKSSVGREVRPLSHGLGLKGRNGRRGANGTALVLLVTCHSPFLDVEDYSGT